MRLLRPRPVRPTLRVMGAALCGFLAIGVVLPVLPRYVRGPVGGGDVAVGVVFGIFAVTALLSRPVAGRLADRFGGRAVLVAGLCAAVGAGVLLFVPLGIGSLVCARLTVGAAEGFIAIGGTLLSLELAPADARGRAIGLFGLSFWIGLSLGAVVGEAVFRLGGYDAVWACATMLPVAGILVGMRLPASPRRVAAQPVGLLRALLPLRPAVGPGILLALGGYGYAAMTGFIVLRLNAEGGSDGAVALTAFAGTSVGARLVAAGLPDRLGGARGATLALALESAGLAIVAGTTDLASAVGGACLAGFGVALLFPSLSLMVLERVEDHRRAAAMGGFTAFLDLGVAVSGPASGAVAAAHGYAAAFWLASALAAAAAVVLGGRSRVSVPVAARESGSTILTRTQAAVEDEGTDILPGYREA